MFTRALVILATAATLSAHAATVNVCEDAAKAKPVLTGITVGVYRGQVKLDGDMVTRPGVILAVPTTTGCADLTALNEDLLPEDDLRVVEFRGIAFPVVNAVFSTDGRATVLGTTTTPPKSPTPQTTITAK